ITARRLAIGHEQNRLARGGYLDATQWRRVRQDVRAPRVRECGTVQAVAHPIRLGGHHETRLEQRLVSRGLEHALVRSADDAQTRSAARHRERRGTTGRGGRRTLPAPRPSRMADRQDVAGLERPSAERADAADEARRPAPERRVHVEAAGYRERGPGAAPPLTKMEPSAGGKRER